MWNKLQIHPRYVKRLTMFITPPAPTSCKEEPPFLVAEWQHQMSWAIALRKILWRWELGLISSTMRTLGENDLLGINVWYVWDKHAIDSYIENISNLFKLQLLQLKLLISYRQYSKFNSHSGRTCEVILLIREKKDAGSTPKNKTIFFFFLFTNPAIIFPYSSFQFC